MESVCVCVGERERGSEIRTKEFVQILKLKQFEIWQCKAGMHRLIKTGKLKTLNFPSKYFAIDARQDCSTWQKSGNYFSFFDQIFLKVGGI